MMIKIIISIFMWIIYLIAGTSMLVALFFLLKVLIWKKLKKTFKRKVLYLDKEILEEDPFGKKGD